MIYNVWGTAGLRGCGVLGIVVGGPEIGPSRMRIGRIKSVFNHFTNPWTGVYGYVLWLGYLPYADNLETCNFIFCGIVLVAYVVSKNQIRVSTDWVRNTYKVVRTPI